MRAEKGKRVTISFICRLEDGTFYDVADHDTLQFIIGQGNTLPTLETGVIGMHPGEHRVIRVPAAEADEFPFDQEEAPTDSHFAAGTRSPAVGYEFGPGDSGDDVLLAPPSRLAPPRQIPPAGSYLTFDVDVLKVEEADVDLAE